MTKPKELTEGDRVLSQYGTGTVRDLEDGILVEHDEDFPEGHSASINAPGVLPRGCKTGYFFHRHHLRKLPDKKEGS